MNAYSDDYILIKIGATPGSKILVRDDYYCQSGSSDKVYIGVKVQDPNHVLNLYYCLYGARGKQLQAMAYSYDSYIQKLNERIRKGYSKCDLSYTLNINGSTIPTATHTPAPTQTIPVHNPDSEVAIQSWPLAIWPQGASPMPKDEAVLQELIDNKDYIYEYKYRGVRATLHIPPEGVEETARIFGRNAVQDNPTRPHEFTPKLMHLATLKFPKELEGTVLDGEILSTKYGHTVGSDAKIAGDLSAEDGRDNSHLYFVAFDMPVLNCKEIVNKPWHERRQLLEIVCHKLVLEGIDIKASWYTDKDKAEAHNRILAAGGEGGIFKNIHATYSYGKKPKAWIKWKRIETDDVVIMGYTIAEPGKYNNGMDIVLIGAIEYGMYVECTLEQYNIFMNKHGLTEIRKYGDKPEFFKSADDKFYQLTYVGKCSGLSDPARREFTSNGNAYLGKVMKIYRHEKSADGTDNLARYGGMHEDKEAYMCIYDGTVKAKRASTRKRKTNTPNDNSVEKTTA